MIITEPVYSHRLGSSNSKIQQNGLEILSKLVVRLREDFRPYIASVLPACTDRMGDAKELIRDTNADLLNKMMEVRRELL